MLETENNSKGVKCSYPKFERERIGCYVNRYDSKLIFLAILAMMTRCLNAQIGGGLLLYLHVQDQPLRACMTSNIVHHGLADKLTFLIFKTS